MDITVYLPDDLAARAKESGINLSRTLRDALTAELERRTAVERTLDSPEVYEVEVEDGNGRSFTGRITGKLIASDEAQGGDVTVYLTTDDRVIVHHQGRTPKYWVVENPVEDLRDWLGPASYTDAMEALGEQPIIDL